jgi:hypothetical protein
MHNIFWNIIEAANVAIEILIVLLYFNKLFAPSYECKRIYIGGYSAAALILYLTGILTSNSTVLITVTFSLLLLISILLYEGTIIQKAFLSLLFIVIVFISEILFIGIMTALDIGMPSEIVEQGTSRIIGMVGTKIIYFWIVVFVCRLINKKLKEVPLKQWVMIVLMPVVSTVILYIIFYDLLSVSVNGGMVIYCVAVLGLLYINFAVFDFFETYLKQLRLSVLEQVIERENTNYKQIENAYNDMRKLKHDVTNQLDVVNNLIIQNDRNSAESVIKSISEQLESVNAVCYTGEPIIDSVINIKLKYAHELGINITKRIKIAAFNLDKIELCRAIGNALDNAIEGCQRSNLSEQHIHISIQQVDDKIVIEITNSAENVDLNNLQTSKKNKSAHGVGMDSIRASVKKLNGYMKYDCKDNIFSLKMVVSNK